MKRLILFLLLATSYTFAQSDDAFVTFGFLRDRGILKEDTLLYVKPEMLTREIAKIPVGTADTNALITPTKLDSILAKLPKGADSSVFITSRILDSVVQSTIARIPKGDSGATGAQGIRGEKGDKGDSGSVGLQGIQGNTGSAGSNGTNGTDGAGFLTTTAATSATTGTMTVNMTTRFITITPTGACTFNASGGTTGNIIHFVVTTSGTTSYTLTFGTNFKKVGTLATGTTTARSFVVTFVYDGTFWREICRTAAQT